MNVLTCEESNFISFIHSFIHLFIYLFIYLLYYYLFIYLFVLQIYLFIYLFIYYIINIMNVRKFAQEMYFYLLVASLHLIRKN